MPVSGQSAVRVESQRRRPIWPAAAVLVLAVVAAYHNSFRGPFIFDDADSITKNPTIRSLRPVWRVLSPPTEGETVTGRPLLNLSLAVNYAVSGPEVWSYHVVNLLVHALAGLALFGVVRRTLLLPLLQDRFGRTATFLALSVALIWALHPLQTESVTYIVQRAESLVGLFYLLTLYCAIRGAETTKATPWHILAALACLLGMASKEVMVSAPLIVLLYDRTFLAGSFKQALRKRWVLHVSLAATWVLLAWLMIAAHKRGGTAGFGTGVSAWSYLLNQFRWIVRYMRLSFWPDPLVLDYGDDLPWTAADVWPHALLVLGLLGATVWAIGRRPKVGFFGAWFFALLAPTSSVVPVATHVAAEHRMYLALAAVVGLSVTAAWWVGQRLASRPGAPRAGPLRRLAPAAALVVIGAALGWRTVERNRDYRSELAIWKAAVAAWPANARAYNGVGIALDRQEDPGGAARYYRQALEIKPDFAIVHDNLGLVLEKLGKPDEAIEHFDKALKIDPALAEAHNNWGYVLVTRKDGKKDLDGAIQHLREALRINPRLHTPHYNLGLAFEEKGMTDEAVRNYEEALKLQPDFAAARLNLAEALAKQGKLDPAADQYLQMLCLNPANAAAHHRLGLIRIRQGRTDPAIASFRRAVELDPGLAAAHYHLAQALAGQGQWAAAIPGYERALQLRPDHPGNAECHVRLAVAFASLGRMDQAVTHFRQALRLKDDHIEAANNIAWLLATQPSPAAGDPAEAVAWAQRACRLTGNARPDLLDTLAAAYAQNGMFPQAVQTAQEALKLAEASGPPQLADGIKTRLKLYREGKPFRAE